MLTLVHYYSRLNLKQRSELGQILTPALVARFMAGQFLREENFIEASSGLDLPLFTKLSSDFTHAILNPPYKKIHSKSIKLFCKRSIDID